MAKYSLLIRRVPVPDYCDEIMVNVYEFPGRILHLNQQEYLYFGGTDYLGLSTHRDFVRALTKNLQQWGANYGSSRMANVRLSVYEEAEQHMARQLGCEAVLTVSSGSLAAQLALHSYQDEVKGYFHLPETHPAAIYPSSKVWQDENKIPAQLVLSADTFPSNAVRPELLKNFSPSHLRHLHLVADDSHGLGISGNQGNGQMHELQKIGAREVTVVASLAKAMCLPGGMIAGKKERIQKIKESPAFVTASGMPPAYLQTFLQLQPLYKLQYKKLKSNLQAFAAFMNHDFSGYTFSKDYPVIYSTHHQLATFLKENHIMIVNFDYPQPGNTLNRIVLTAHHREEDVKQLATALKKFVTN